VHPVPKEPQHPDPHDAAQYCKPHKIETIFAQLKDLRRVATRYDRCPKVLMSACALAGGVMVWF
jgi:transposase